MQAGREKNCLLPLKSRCSDEASRGKSEEERPAGVCNRMAVSNYFDQGQEKP